MLSVLTFLIKILEGKFLRFSPIAFYLVILFYSADMSSENNYKPCALMMGWSGHVIMSTKG